MKFTFEIDSRNAAMCGGGRRAVAQHLRKAADEVEAGSAGAGLVDNNGNSCGDWRCDDERPDLENCEAAELFQFADDFGVALDDDPRDLERAELVEGLEAVGCACYDDESDELLAAAYGDSMLAGDLPGDSNKWRDECREAWEA
jgi:hypothetical protein